MAERRMFAKTIVDSDLFLDMPLSTQCLYFHLSMRADDEGFINNTRKIQRMIGSQEDDIKLLVAKKFVIPFETGVVVIRHWKIHNYIQKDRLKETLFIDEKATITQDESGAYTSCIQNVHSLDTQDRLVQDRLEKDRLVQDRLEPEEKKQSRKKQKAKDVPLHDAVHYSFYVDTYNRICTRLPKITKLTTDRKLSIDKFEAEDFTREEFETICVNVNTSDWHTGRNDRNWKADITFMTRPDKAVMLLEKGAYNTRRGSVIVDETQDDEPLF